MKGPKFFSIEFSRSEALVCSSYFFFRTAVLRKLFDIRFSCKHCNFSSVSVLVKMASKTLTRSIYQRRLLKKAIGGKLFSFSRLEWHSARPPHLTLIFSIFYEIKLGIFFPVLLIFVSALLSISNEIQRALFRVLGIRAWWALFVFRRHGAVFLPQKITAFCCFLFVLFCYSFFLS